MTCFRVPLAIMAAFAPRRRVPVVVAINGYSWRTTIAPYGSDFYVPVRAEIRAAIAAAAGDVVQVAMQRDIEARQVEVPADLAAALERAGTRATFDALSFSHRKEYVGWIADAKRQETRDRRIAATVAKLATRPTARPTRPARIFRRSPSPAERRPR